MPYPPNTDPLVIVQVINSIVVAWAGAFLSLVLSADLQLQPPRVLLVQQGRHVKHAQGLRSNKRVEKRQTKSNSIKSSRPQPNHRTHQSGGKQKKPHVKGWLWNYFDTESYLWINVGGVGHDWGCGHQVELRPCVYCVLCPAYCGESLSKNSNPSTAHTCKVLCSWVSYSTVWLPFQAGATRLGSEERPISASLISAYKPLQKWCWHFLPDKIWCQSVDW